MELRERVISHPEEVLDEPMILTERRLPDRDFKSTEIKKPYFQRWLESQVDIESSLQQSLCREVLKLSEAITTYKQWLHALTDAQNTLVDRLDKLTGPTLSSIDLSKLTDIELRTFRTKIDKEINQRLESHVEGSL